MVKRNDLMYYAKIGSQGGFWKGYNDKFDTNKILQKLSTNKFLREKLTKYNQLSWEEIAKIMQSVNLNDFDEVNDKDLLKSFIQSKVILHNLIAKIEND